MEKLYVLSDIHGNLEALNTIMNSIGQEEFLKERKIFLGDYTDFCPWPDEVIDIIRQLPNSRCLLGNHDLYAIDETNEEAMKYFRNERLLSHTLWTRSQLSKKNLEWLKQLPTEIYGTLGKTKPVTFYATHADYKNISRKFSPSNLMKIDAGLVLCGHTHYAMKDEINGRLLINPGSAGEPLDGNNMASYAIISCDSNGNIYAENRRVKYNLQKVAQVMEEKQMVLREEIIKTLKKAGFD